ncbi:Endo-1,4-beta-xylanase A precursor [compost metagenome]
MKKYRSITSIVLLSLMLTGPLGWIGESVQAQSGTDSQTVVLPLMDDWLVVSTTEQLVYINEHQEQYLDKHIRLGNDIDLTGVTWIPLGGNEYPPFSGVFDGQGHMITGLVIDGDTRTNVGFFGEATGSIRNVSLNVDITGGSITGGVTGYQSGGSIEGAYTEGNVTSLTPLDPNKVISTGGITGGLVNARVERSSSAASVTVGWGYNMYGAGIAGHSSGSTIIDSYFDGQVRNVADVGNSFVFSAGIGAYFYGGTGSRNTVRNTYSRGYMHSDNPGSFTERSAVISYANTTDIYSSYFDQETTGVSAGVGSYYNTDTVEAVRKSRAEMKQQATYVGWDFNQTWNMHPSVNDGYPYLRPRILTEELQPAVAGEPYSLKISGWDGAHAGLIWSATGLPPGMSLSPSGELQGTPFQLLPGNIRYTVVITATDAGAAAAVRSFQLEVKTRAPELVNASVQPGIVAGSTSIMAIPRQAGHTFAYVLNHAEASPPLTGDTLPADAMPYIPGMPIPGVSPGQTLDVYEVDIQQRIQGWQRFVLEEQDIRQFVPVTSIRLETNALTLMAGEAPTQLIPILEPAEATNRSVSWLSTQPTVASVSPSGEVTPLAPGQAVITATASNGSTVEAIITVIPATGTVTGSVYSTVSSSVYGPELLPLADAVVSIGSSRALTNDDGIFQLDQIPVGLQTIIVEASGYRTSVQTVNVQRGQSADTGMITLTISETSEPEEPQPEPHPGPDPEPETPQPQPEPEPGPGPGTPPENEPSPEPEPSPAPDRSSRDRDGRSSSTGQNIPTASSLIELSLNGQNVWVPMSSETTADAQEAIRLKPDASSLIKAFAANRELLIRLDDNSSPVVYLELPGEALLEMLKRSEASAMDYGITLAANNVSYPLSLDRLSDLGPVLDANTVVTMIIRQADASTVNRLETVLAQQGANLIGSPVTFSLEINGQTSDSLQNRSTSINTPLYPKRSMSLPFPVDPTRSTAVWIDTDTMVHFVPTLFHANEASSDETELGEIEDDSTGNTSIETSDVATIYSPHDGLFAVITSNHVFADIHGHWAQDDIELMANKQIVQGEVNYFRPDISMTRGELATLLVRSLGLIESGATSSFTDISTQARYAKAVSTAQGLGLIEGYDDGTFRPDASVTREQLAVILSRTLRLTGKMPQTRSEGLELFSDKKQIAAWAVEPIAQLLDSDIIRGTTAAEFSPKAPATRAHSIVMLKRMLQHLEYMN